MTEWIKSFFHNFVKDLKNIIFALVIAIIVWFAISMQIFPDVTTHISDIPVEVKATDYMTQNNLSVTDGYVDKGSVQITGKRYDRRRFHRKSRFVGDHFRRRIHG